MVRYIMIKNGYWISGEITHILELHISGICVIATIENILMYTIYNLLGRNIFNLQNLYKVMFNAINNKFT